MHSVPRFLFGNLVAAMVLIQLDGSWAHWGVHHPVWSALAAALCFGLSCCCLLSSGGRIRAACIAPALAYLSIGVVGTLIQYPDQMPQAQRPAEVLAGCLLNGWFVVQMTRAGVPTLIWAALWTVLHVRRAPDSGAGRCETGLTPDSGASG